MSSIKLSAQKVKDVSNLQTIAKGWKTYTVDNNFGIVLHPSFLGGFEFVHYLSGGSLGQRWQGQEKSILNDPYVYISPGDKYASKVVKEAISGPAGNNDGFLLPYMSIKNDIGTDITLSYCLISGLSASVPLAITPVAFTRGLKANGKWHSKYGLYGDKGGYVVFCDGHVTWFDGSRPAKFLHWNGQEYTTDIRNAIPNGTFISAGWMVSDNIKDNDDSLLIMQHAGAGGV
jgi:prepilin-type processing-associated H-X9-DG protein